MIFLLATTMALSLSGAAAAQQLADERTRREALEHYRAGSELLSAEQFEKAAEQFQKAIAKDPLFALAHYGLGQAHMGLQRYASAIHAYIGCRTAYQQMAGLAQSDSVAVDRQREEEIRELQQSIRQIRRGQIKTLNPENQVLKLENRVRELERMRQRTLDPAKPPAEVSLALGSAYFRNGDLQDAEREWNAAATVNSKLGEAHNNLAVVYMMSGRKKAAEEAVKAAEKAGFRVNPRLKEDIRKLPQLGTWNSELGTWNSETFQFRVPSSAFRVQLCVPSSAFRIPSSVPTSAFRVPPSKVLSRRLLRAHKDLG